MQSRQFAAIGLGLVMLSGCTSLTQSGFRSVDGNSCDAEIDVELDDESNGNVYDQDYGGAAFAIGVGYNTVNAYAGLMPNSTGGAQVNSGTATYSGEYEALRVTGVEKDGPYLVGFVSRGSDDIDLTADFDAQTLTGTSDAGVLEVDGTISGTEVGGSVVYHDVEGDLEGVIGADAVIGAFHGHDADEVFAGGFIAERQ